MAAAVVCHCSHAMDSFLCTMRFTASFSSPCSCAMAAAVVCHCSHAMDSCLCTMRKAMPDSVRWSWNTFSELHRNLPNEVHSFQRSMCITARSAYCLITSCTTHPHPTNAPLSCLSFILIEACSSTRCWCDMAVAETCHFFLAIETRLRIMYSTASDSASCCSIIPCARHLHSPSALLRYLPFACVAACFNTR